MCFVKAPKMPEQQAPPVPAPAPSPTPSSISAQSADETRRKRLDRIRYGLASTIKTSPLGITGSASDLTAMAGGKEKIGA